MSLGTRSVSWVGDHSARHKTLPKLLKTQYLSVHMQLDEEGAPRSTVLSGLLLHMSLTLLLSCPQTNPPEDINIFLSLFSNFTLSGLSYL